jgi:MFS family permease
VFRAAQQEAERRAAAGERETMPIIDVFRRYPREVFTAMGARFAENVSYYVFTIVVVTYLTKSAEHKLSSSFVLNAVLIGAAVHLVTIPIWGALSDRFGRRPIYLLGAVGVGVWAFVFIYLVDTENFALTVLAVVGGLLFHGAMYGPQAAFLSELFGTKVRYSGVSIGYQLASIVAGGLAPILGVWLYSQYGGYAVAVYVALSALVSVLAVATYGETSQRDLAADHAVAAAVER